jgi:hypothetical protein
VFTQTITSKLYFKTKMMPSKRLALISAISLMGTFFLGSAGLSQASQPTVHLTTEPSLDRLLPFEAEASTLPTPVHLALQAIDAAGQPLQNSQIHLKITTPSHNPWLTTDFPIVEETELLDITASAPQGKLQLQQMLPIRGNYQIQVEVTPTKVNQFTPFQQTRTLPVRENWVKYRNFGILAAILLAAGLGGGLVIGGQQKIRPGEIAPYRVRILLSGAAIVAIAALLAINLNNLGSESHAEIADTPNSLPSLSQQNLQLQIAGDTQATVGQLATLVAQVKDVAGQPVSDVFLNVTVTSLESGWTALAYQGTPDRDGKLTWRQQFFDGAPHQVAVEVLPQPQSSRQFRPFQVTKAIEVMGVAPPLLMRLITLFYLTVFLLIGLAMGLGWQKYQARLLGKHRVQPNFK